MAAAGGILAIVGFVGALSIATVATGADEPTAPSPTASPIADPCGSLISIVTRPTVTTSVCTVRGGHALLENGYSNATSTGAGAGTSVTYPQSLLRIGTADPHLEFAFTPPSFDRTSAGDAIATGWSDIGIGAKYELGYGRRWLYGVNAIVTVPTGARAFSAGNAQYTGNFNWTYTLDSVIGFDGTVGVNALSGLNAAHVAQSYFACISSFEATASLPDGSEFFGEYAYFSQAGAGLGAGNLVDFGYVRDLGAHVQVDVEYGTSPAPQGGLAQHYVGAGLSFMN